MKWNLTGTSIPRPSEIGAILRELAPDLCDRFSTLEAFQEYVWAEKNLKEIRVHPRHEQFARLWCGCPMRLMWGDTIQPLSFTLFIQPTVPEYEMQMVYTDHVRIIELDKC